LTSITPPSKTTSDTVPFASSPFMASITGSSRTLPLAFSADILQWLPVPETSRGGSTNPSDQRAYLWV
jgi:hypothetical protein